MAFGTDPRFLNFGEGVRGGRSQMHVGASGLSFGGAFARASYRRALAERMYFCSLLTVNLR